MHGNHGPLPWPPPRLDLLGFVAYKTWGPPVPGVSVGAVGVADKHRGKGYGRQLMNLDCDFTTTMAVLLVPSLQAENCDCMRLYNLDCVAFKCSVDRGIA